MLWLNTLSSYRQNRLEEFSRGYHLLKVSHDALEQRVAGTTQNMREALTTLRAEFLSGGKDDALPLWGYGARVLDLFARYGWVQVAGVFVCDGAKLAPEPVEILGETWDVSVKDPLLQEAFREAKLVSIQGENPGAGVQSKLLAAIPLVDVEGKVWGIVAVHQMLFVAFQGDNLHLLAILGGHMGDIFTFGTRMINGDPLGVRHFRSQLKRSLGDLRSFRLPASLVSLVLDCGEDRETLASDILSQRRGLDQAILLRQGDGVPVILILLNLTDDNGLDGYLTRLRSILQEGRGQSLEELGIQVMGRSLSPRHKAGVLLDDIFAACQVVETSE